MNLRITNLLLLCCFSLFGWNSAAAQLDCDCSPEIDPVCVVTPDGEIVPFLNACFAECLGYGEDVITVCPDDIFPDDCDCPDDEFDPVCVLTAEGIVCPFPNMCLAECAGYTDADLVDCENDCNCPGEYNPVCVLLDDGTLIEFPNACEAECAGFGPDQIQSCDGGECTALIIATQADDEGFVWAFGSIVSGNVATYFWDFGDGNTSTEATPVHTYSTPGAYFVSLTVTTEDGCTSTAWHVLYAGNCYNIIIALPTEPFTYAFGAIATGTPVSYFWEFGDGASSDEPAPVHTYPGPGVYEVSLTTTHEDDCEWTSITTIEITEPCDCPEDIYDPVCVITPDGDIIEFVNPCEAECAGYGPDEWVPCDGCNCPEIYDPVCVLLWDGTILEFDNACFAECEGYGPDQFVPCSEDCSVEINADPTDDENFEWSFDAITNNDILIYEWDFGDGNTSTEANPTHTYTTPGIYFISLTVVDIEGCVATANTWIYAGNCYNIILAIPSGNFTYAFGSIANSEVVSYLWDFGDGNTSTEGAPVHTYPGPGTYDVTLTTVHEDDCIWTSTITIEILEDCICPDVFDPVCVIGDNGDAIEFFNACEAECAGYTPDQMFECEDCNCPEIYDPVCVVHCDGEIIQFDNACFAECAGYGPDQFVPCDNCECPEDIYDPVCVITLDGEFIEFVNPCEAECAGYGPDTWIACEDDCICTDEWDPVCVVTDFGEFYMFGNMCEAECAGFGPEDVVDCENDCICEDIYDPVCVQLVDGVIIQFSNDCYAECAGFGPDQFVDCTEFQEDGPVDSAPVLHLIFEQSETGFTGADLPEFVQEMLGSNSFLPLQAEIAPNPVSGEELNLTVNTSSSVEAQISIISIDGKISYVQENLLHKGEQTMHLDVHAFVPGIYFVKIQTAEETKTLKFIKQ